MKHLVEREKLTDTFMNLTCANRDYVLAIARALIFAQNNIEESPPKLVKESKSTLVKTV